MVGLGLHGGSWQRRLKGPHSRGNPHSPFALKMMKAFCDLLLRAH